MGETRRRLMALLVVLFLVAAACGGGGDDDAADDDGTDTSAPADGGDDTDPAGVIRIGYDLVAGNRGGMTLDPTEVTTQLTDNGLFYYVYGLFLRPTDSGELVPDLAESTEIVDPNTIELELREGLRFSDGTPFDAEVVKAGIERNLSATESVGYGTAFFDLASIEVVDVRTLRLDIPNGSAASWHDTFLASWETSIVKPGTTDFTRPIGAGPMVITEHRPEQSVVLEKNPGYWDAEHVLVGGVEYVHAPMAQAASSALQADQIDLALLEPQLLPTLSGDLESLIVPNPNQLGSLMLCKRDAPLDDARVRLALNKALDRDAINEAVFSGAYTPAYGLWPDGHRFHDPAVNEAVEHDPDGARQLLEEAGYADGLSFDIHVLEAASMPEMTEAMQQQFAEVGVEVNLVPSPNYVPDFLVAQAEGAGAVPTMSPNRLKLLQWVGESVGNTCRYDDPELVALQAELNAVSDASDEAAEIWHRIEQKAVATDALSVFTFFGSAVLGYDTSALGDLTIMPFTLPAPDLRTTFVKA